MSTVTITEALDQRGYYVCGDEFAFMHGNPVEVYCDGTDQVVFRGTPKQIVSYFELNVAGMSVYAR